MKAENSKLIDISQLQTELAEERLKPNSALVIIDFLIQYGIITGENEKDYIEISDRLHHNPGFSC